MSCPLSVKERDRERKREGGRERSGKSVGHGERKDANTLNSLNAPTEIVKQIIVNIEAGVEVEVTIAA